MFTVIYYESSVYFQLEVFECIKPRALVCNRAVPNEAQVEI